MSDQTPTADNRARTPSFEEKLRAEAAAAPSQQPAASTASGWTLPALEGHGRRARGEHDDRLLAKARATFAWKQLMRCFPTWSRVDASLREKAISTLADNKPVDPNAPETWRSEYDHATAVLRRHGITRMTDRLTLPARSTPTAGQADLDREAGIDWTRLHQPLTRLDQMLRRAHRALPLDLTDPQVFIYDEDRRRAAARKLDVAEHHAEDLSRWALDHIDEFDPTDLRSWRIASPTWLELAEAVLPAVDRVERPVAAFVVPEVVKTKNGRRPVSPGAGWQLIPTLSLDMIRLVCALGGTVGRELISAEIPGKGIPGFLEATNHNTLHAGPKENLDSAKQLSEDLSRALGVTINPGIPKDTRDRWGRLLVRRDRYTRRATLGSDGEGEQVDNLLVSVVTYPAKGFQQRRLGNRPRDPIHGDGARSAAMELGEAIQAAVERDLPLLLSTEAAGFLHGVVRVGRLKGRPGMVSITTSDGLSATTRRMVAEQAVSELRRLRREEAIVSIDAGANQVIRMTVARPLTDDPILKGRQQDIAAQMVVGSGVNASQTGAGKTIMSGRTLYHRAATTRRFRAIVVAEGRLLGQWQSELEHGAPARGLPALAPNAQVLVVDDRSSVAAQIRAGDRAGGDRAVVYLVPNSILDRYVADLQAIDYHLLIADEAQRYVNPATEAHIALKQLRLGSVVDCWLLTATPKGKTSEDLDVLVGLAVGDEAMIRERLNSRESGDLMDEVNAHRLRVNFGPHLVRVTREDMKAWMPEVRPAQPLAIEADSALAELLDAVRRGGRDAYRRLLQVVRELRTLDQGSQLYKRALVEMSRAQATVLSYVNVFVDVSVDPETALHSQAALAQALCEQGLVAEAMRGGGDGLPLLRGITAQTIAGVVGEEQVIVFAERNWCLRQLARTLREGHGVDARVADGTLDSDEFEAMKQQFVDGRFPVLCLSKVGQEGHNFQNASVLVHLDLPWTQKPLEQRVGRAARPGSKTGYVQTYIPYVKRGGIEHVVSILAERGAEHHQILDSFEGVTAADSTVANQLGQITSDVAQSKGDAGFAATAARLRVAASVFGS
jgi:superfamily II DNA or RNA helicase